LRFLIAGVVVIVALAVIWWLVTTLM